MRNQQFAEYLFLLLLIGKWFRLFSLKMAFLNRFVDLINAIICKANIESHFCVVLRPLFQFSEIIPNIWVSFFECTLEISSNDHFHIIFYNQTKDVVLLVYLAQLFKLLSCKPHKKRYFVFAPIEVLNGKCVERCKLNTQLQTIQQTFFESLSALNMARKRLYFLFLSESSVSIHNKSNVTWNFSLSQHFDC